MPDVIVVGAGLAGLTAARRLQADGADVVVLDKGRGVGGRLATRGVDGPAGPAVLDHGAQFLTVRSDVFAAEVATWPTRVWHHGPATARSAGDDPASAEPGGDGHPRHVGDGGMTAIAKHLAAGLDVRCRTRVTAVESGRAGGWAVRTVAADGTRTADVAAARLLLTAPVPQSLALLPADVDVPPAVRDLAYHPCLALLGTTDVDPPHPAVQFAEGPLRFIADNRSKGASPVPAITVHAGDAWSQARWDDPDDAVAADLARLARPWIAPARWTGVHVKRWRYATPVAPHPDRAVVLADGVVLAGDAFGEAKVEGAARSGMAAATLLTG